MHTGTELGEALRIAIERMGVSQTAVGNHFGIKQSSVNDWIKTGRIGKKHLERLVQFFAPVVGPEHWGLPSHWHYGGEPMTADERELLERYRALKVAKRDRVLGFIEGLSSAPDDASRKEPGTGS